MERAEEEWGKVERVEEELSGHSYVNGPRTQGADAEVVTRNT